MGETVNENFSDGRKGFCRKNLIASLNNIRAGVGSGVS